jgi:hypothetical protein
MVISSIYTKMRQQGDLFPLRAADFQQRYKGVIAI